jgi:DNA (cytosine-5)-methyltransferase 1
LTPLWLARNGHVTGTVTACLQSTVKVSSTVHDLVQGTRSVHLSTARPGLLVSAVGVTALGSCRELSERNSPRKAGDQPDHSGRMFRRLPGRSRVLSAPAERISLVGSLGIAISLFSGVGGLDLGAERAGYEVRAAVEWDRDAAATMATNFPHLASSVIQKDILNTSTEEILAAAGLRDAEPPDLLLGGPPCTPFSKSGFWLEWKREGLDPDASLLQAYTRVLDQAKPRRFVLENVYALTYNNKASRPALERLMREIDDAGYHCRAKVLNAADYGVPQSRPRLFIIGVPKGEPLPDHPKPTHGGLWERRVSGDPERPHVTAGEALAGLGTQPEPEESVNGKWGHLLPAIPPGDNYLYYTEKRGHPAPLFNWRSKYWSFLLKLSPDKPAPTIQAQPGPYVGPFHWESRRLRAGETKRLFTYPDDFELVGSRASVQAQLGNSVPPLMAEMVVRSFTDGFVRPR